MVGCTAGGKYPVYFGRRDSCCSLLLAGTGRGTGENSCKWMKLQLGTERMVHQPMSGRVGPSTELAWKYTVLCNWSGIQVSHIRRHQWKAGTCTQRGKCTKTLLRFLVHVKWVPEKQTV